MSNINKKSKDKQSKIHPIIKLIVVSILLVAGIFCINTYQRNDNSIIVEGLNLKENEVVYKNYIYTLPNDWRVNSYKYGLNILFNTTYGEKTYYNGGVINLQRVSSTGRKKEEIFKDISFFEDRLNTYHPDLRIGKGELLEYKNDIIIVFPCERIQLEGVKFLFVFMLEDDNHYYNIQFYSNRDINENEDELFYNYDDLNTFIDFLNTRVKRETRVVKEPWKQHSTYKTKYNS